MKQKSKSSWMVDIDRLNLHEHKGLEPIAETFLFRPNRHLQE